MSERSVALVILALLALPTVVAHGGVEDEDRYIRRPAEERDVTVPDGYTGPGREPYLSYFEGVWLYGQLAATAVNDQRPVDLHADGDWVVWEDARRSDIFAFSISAGQGFYLTNDGFVQHHPRVSGNVVVFEHYTQPVRGSIYAYFLDTGEIRRLSAANASAKDPAIDYPLVAWTDQNNTNPDIWAYSLLNNTAWNLHPGTDRDSDPTVVGDRVFWRTQRYNLWDIEGFDTFLETPVQVTADGAMQSSPFTNGEDLFYVTRHMDGGWTVDRFDPETQTSSRSNFYVPDASKNSASGDALVRVAQELDFSQIVVRNLTSGATNHVTGNLLLLSAPVILDRTIFASVETKEGASLLQLKVSPFALAKRPTLTVTSPMDRTRWDHPIVVTGVLQAGPEFTEPSTFTYRVDDEPPQLIPPGERWRFTLDHKGVPAGEHVVTIRATFREGPPVTTTLLLSVPAPSQSVDLGAKGPAFYGAYLMSELNNYVLANPASWFLIPLVLLIVVLILVRLWIWFKPRRRASVAEYVNPDAE